MRRALIATTLLFALACKGDDGPSSPRTNCANLAGSYNGRFLNSCGGLLAGPVVVAQQGCSFSALVPGSGGASIQGTIQSSTQATYTGTFNAPCNGQLSGTASISSTAVNGTWSGNVSGAGCCGPNISGSFTLTR